MAHRRPVAKDGTNWRTVWIVSAIAWFAMSILEAASVYPWRLSMHHPLPFWTMFKDTFVHNILGWMLTPAIYKLALLFPFAPKRILKPTGVHLAGSVLFALANATFHYLLFPLHLSPDSNMPVTVPIFFGFASYAWFLDTCSTYVPVLAIAYMFSFHHKYREGEMQRLRLDAQLAQAQLQALRSQMNPHFLFNTLHSITSLMHFDLEAADRMMVQLSDLLRTTLQQSQVDEIELAQELDFLERYLAIEKQRIGDRLRVDIRIADDVTHAMVPPLLLQPLVENAVIHGISQEVNGGELYLRAVGVSGTLRITLRNTGRLQRSSFRAPGHSGVGIRNLKERLTQMYANDCYFAIEENGKRNVEVTIILPLKLKDSATPEHSKFKVSSLS